MLRLTPLEPWIAQKTACATQQLSRDLIDAYQLRQLQTTLDLVLEKSRFYHKRLAGSPCALTRLSDLTRLPFTLADDVREDPSGFVCGSQDDIQRVVTLDSSGTTGRPKRIYFTHTDQELTIGFFAVGMSTFTDPGDRVLILLPGETPGSVGDLLAIALGRLGAIAIKYGPVRDAAAALPVIRHERINVIVGVPTHVLALARQDAEPAPTLKSVLLTTDHVPDAIKRAVESAWHCAVYNHYGMTEMGLGGGVECEARCGYHLREADLLFEIIDPVTGEALPDGTYGEVVFTTLTRRGMPLVRYRTGDVTRFIPAPCPCGSNLKRLERIRHRLGGCIPVGDGYLTLAALDEALFALEHVLDFRAAISRENGHNCLDLEIKWTGSAQPDAALDTILSTIPVAQRLAIRIHSAAILPASMAKRTIIDRRN